MTTGSAAPAAGPDSPGTTWPAVLSGLLSGTDLTAGQTTWAMDEVMSGRATPAQIAAFAVALRAKGETPAELAGLVDGMLAHARRLDVAARAVDIVGTGGDRANTVNISSMAAVVTAAAGATVVKHGNRAASSSCGAADLGFARSRRGEGSWNHASEVCGDRPPDRFYRFL